MEPACWALESETGSEKTGGSWTVLVRGETLLRCLCAFVAERADGDSGALRGVEEGTVEGAQSSERRRRFEFLLLGAVSCATGGDMSLSSTSAEPVAERVE